MHSSAREVLSASPGIGLGCHDEVRGYPTRRAKRPADPPLALAVAVLVGGVEEPHITIEYAAHGGDGAPLVDVVSVQLGRAPERARSNTDDRDARPVDGESVRLHGFAVRP